MSPLQRIAALTCLTACAVCVSETATAGSITYTFSGTIFDGTIGTTDLTNEPFTVSVSSDTSEVTSSTSVYGTTFTTPPFQPASITLAGFGTATLTNGATVFDFQNAGGPSELFLSVGLTGTQQFAWIGLGDPAFATYDLTTAIGPIGELSFSSTVSFATSLGNAVIVDVADAPTTFTAQLSGSSVPEPSSLILGLIGLASVGGLDVCKRTTRPRPAKA